MERYSVQVEGRMPLVFDTRKDVIAYVRNVRESWRVVALSGYVWDADASTWTVATVVDVSDVLRSQLEQHRAWHRERMAARRAEYLAGKKCVRCGSTERLEIDHIDPATKVTHRLWGWSRAKRAVELAKCQVLCHDCHNIRTGKQNGGLPDETILGARREYAAGGVTLEQLADRHGVSVAAMRKAVRGLRYRHLPDAVPESQVRHERGWEKRKGSL